MPTTYDCISAAVLYFLVWGCFALERGKTGNTAAVSIVGYGHSNMWGKLLHSCPLRSRGFAYQMRNYLAQERRWVRRRGQTLEESGGWIEEPIFIWQLWLNQELLPTSSSPQETGNVYLKFHNYWLIYDWVVRIESLKFYVNILTLQVKLQIVL